MLRQGTSLPVACLQMACCWAILFANISIAAEVANTTAIARQHLFAVPFPRQTLQLAPPNPVELLLFVSADSGQSWRLAAGCEPAKALLTFAAPQDGEYWFSFRALDVQGRMWPQVAHRGEMKIWVDATPPVLQLDAALNSQGQVEITWVAHDAALDLSTLQLAYRAVDPPGNWMQINVDPRRAQLEHHSARGKLSLSLQGAATQWVIAGQIVDRAGHPAVQEVAVLPPLTKLGAPRHLVANTAPVNPPFRTLANSLTTTDPAFVAVTPTPVGASSEAWQASGNAWPAVNYNTPTQAVRYQAPADDSSSRRGIPEGPALDGSAEVASEATSPRAARVPVIPIVQPIELMPIPGVAQVVPPRNPAAPPNNPAPELLPPLQEPDLDREILLRAARNAVAIGNLEEALRRFERLLDSYPDDVEARGEYAGILVQTRRFNEAVAQYEQLLKLQPNDAPSLLALVNVQLQLRDYTSAAARVQAFLDLHPDETDLAVKLAQIYALNEQLREGFLVYERYLSNLNRQDQQVQAVLGPLLLELKRPQEALPLLEALRERFPRDLLAAANLVRALHELGDQERALQLVQQIAELEPENIEVRLRLGQALIAPESRESAILIYSQVLARKPENVTAKLGLAQVYLKTYEPQQAFALLTSIPADQRTNEHALVWALYHERVGEYADAQAIYRQLLVSDSRRPEWWIASGDCFYDAQEYAKAQGQYLTALALEPTSRPARFRLARNYRAQRHFTEAQAICEELLREDPSNSEAFNLLIETYILQHRFVEAELRSRSRGTLGPNDIRGMLDQRLAVARALLKSGDSTAALHEYRAALALPAGPQPVAMYGVYASLLHAQGKQAARTALAELLTLPAAAVYLRVVISDLALGDCDKCLSVELLQELTKWHPDNLLVRVRYAEALAQDPSTHCNAADAFKVVLSQSPRNIRARIGLARVLGSEREFRDAVSQYEIAIAQQPNQSVARREEARLVFGWKGFEKAAPIYDAALQQTQVRDSISLTSPLARPVPGLPGSSAQDQTDLRLRTIESDAAGAEAAAIATEKTAKYLKDWRPYGAISKYEGLVQTEPINEDAYFDLGQTYSGTNQTECAMDAYRRLLEVNPCHREAAIALHRNWLELRPRWQGHFDYIDQSGRNGLASITKVRVGNSVYLPTGDEDEWLMADYSHVDYDPLDDTPLGGDIFTLGVQEKFSQAWMYFGRMNVEIYPDRFQNRPTFDTGVRFTNSSNAKFTLATFLENVAENGESMRQDIYRFGLRGQIDYQPLRRWEMQLRYRFIDYSDNNTCNDFACYNSFLLTLPPRELKLLANYDFWSYADPTVFNPADPANLSGTIHPYFSPSGFSQIATGLQWKHWLSYDSFKGADEFWYSLMYATQFDSQGQFYSLFRARVQYDVCRTVSTGVDTSLIRSPVYDQTTVSLYLAIRFR